VTTLHSQPLPAKNHPRTVVTVCLYVGMLFAWYFRGLFSAPPMRSEGALSEAERVGTTDDRNLHLSFESLDVSQFQGCRARGGMGSQWRMRFK
jgi:hypothetical protein